MLKYISKIDGKVFESKEELMSHFENQYIQTEESNTDSEYSNILSKLKDAFPEASIEVVESDDFGHQIDLVISIGDNKVESFDFTINKDEYDNGYSQHFCTVEEAIEFYKLYPNQTDLIRETLANNYNLDSFDIIQWFEADQCGDASHLIIIKAIINGVELTLECGLNQTIESFINDEVQPYFVDEIEGNLTRRYGGDWYIGDANMYKFSKRAKKVKLIITELK